jgi:hypothetical protein
MYNTLNYTEQGGEKTVIGGTLEIKEGASVTGLTSTAAPASATALGGVKAAAKEATDTVPVKIGEDGILYVPAYPEVTAVPTFSLSTATTVSGIKTDFNLLLNAMSSAGLIKTVT